jgi:hypothetical protein
MTHREKLLQQMHLTDKDLEANRAGVLSQRQKQGIIQSGLRNLVGAVGISIGLAAILYFVVDKPLVPVQWIVASMLAGAVLIVGFVDFNRTRRAAADGRVECFTGPVQVQARRREGYFLEVEGRSFRLPVHFWHVQNNAPYHVYVATKANRIVALEPDGWD